MEAESKKEGEKEVKKSKDESCKKQNKNKTNEIVMEPVTTRGKKTPVLNRSNT